MDTPKHLTLQELEAGLDRILQSPANEGVLELIVRRPQVNEREVLREAVLDPAEGLVGDAWKTRGTPHPEMQLTLMNSRVIALLASDLSYWPLAGDQLFVDLDLSEANLPPGTRLSLGTALLEVTAEPHTGCKKFAERFGRDAVKFVNSPQGRRLCLRGINAKVIQAGQIRVGDIARKNNPAPRPVPQGRLLILAAALLWSSSGLFAKASIFHDWPLEGRGLLLAFWRALFAGALLAPAVRQPRFHPRLVPMALCFTLMNGTYLSAMTLTTAANAIWLQSTAPLWIFVVGALLRIDPLNRRDLLPLACGLLGIALILSYEIRGQEQTGILLGLLSGLFYAGVVLSLRGLRSENSVWLVTFNHLVAAACLFPYVVWTGLWPSPGQLAVLAAFGLLQMGLPYLLFARGLRSVTSQEASLIGLLEPVLVPVWVFLAWSEEPALWTLAGGGFILTGLATRYAGKTA